MNVPIIDLSPYYHKKPEEETISNLDQCNHVANQVQLACESHGFFYITGYDVELNTTIAKAISCSQKFFNDEECSHLKLQCASKHSKLYRGYTHCGGGNNCVSKANLPELKESFTIGAEGGGRSPMHGPNSWPTLVEDESADSLCQSHFCTSFRADMMTYFQSMLHLSRTVAHVLAVSLGLRGDFFTSRMADPVAQMVAFKYPPEEDGKQVNCGEHTDCGFLTLLVQSSAGLDVFSNSTKEWYTIKPIENAVLVNLGDLTQFWTNGRYKSTPHRVHNKSDRDRYSIVFFANCDFGARLEAMEGDDQVENQNNNNDAITAGEYILKKLDLMWLMGETKEINEK